MLAEERWNKILDLLEEQKTVTVPELTERLDTSEATIRRDLTGLAKRGRLKKVHGGATVIDRQYIMSDEDTDGRSRINIGEKTTIAEYAASLIGPSDFVYIDAGSTTAKLIDCITETRATYVTNSMIHAQHLSAKGCRVFIIGGQVKGITGAIVGAEALKSLERYNFSIAFLGANGVTPEQGFTTPEVEEAAVKMHALNHAKKAYILADNSKFSRIAPVSFGTIDSAVIITDRITDATYFKYKNIVEVSKK
ncbi:MAG: DeoR/GlpR family DNA-binding transcription regulator [Eubacterium sp.]|nr:DeoR/GlpR family DNA-binding transcription regulator [Eubacterium sp.]